MSAAYIVGRCTPDAGFTPEVALPDLGAAKDDAFNEYGVTLSVVEGTASHPAAWRGVGTTDDGDTVEVWVYRLRGRRAR